MESCVLHLSVIFQIRTQRSRVTAIGRMPLNTVHILSCVEAYSENRHFRVFVMIKIGQRSTTKNKQVKAILHFSFFFFLIQTSLVNIYV